MTFRKRLATASLVGVVAFAAAQPASAVQRLAFGTTVDNLKCMARDQLDIGLVTTSTLYHAYNGELPFKGIRANSSFSGPIRWRLRRS